MKKRIEEDGVVYTIDATSGNCIDIDVKPGVEEASIFRLDVNICLVTAKRHFLMSGKS